MSPHDLFPQVGTDSEAHRRYMALIALSIRLDSGEDELSVRAAKELLEAGQ
ncbi:hypothetical protein [Stakelama pacifica]|uniref:Uncharacterized protein n=1 Tax=Stakelama pacifica TaxID=517720 RepID=A0A4R6FMZ5_9SPHN|nr:hypothetical protein [Stakelama pacifica]TDN82966.1 hypothetical protein EV664_105164 [Stakelama pacifica]GGO95057.1 hypothetical protein GCM10011329_18340 [Stakelama pacifica]